MSSPGGAYERAIAAFQAARFSEAEALLREALARSPDFVEALQLLGTVLSAQGRAAEGLQWLDRARAARPTPAIMHNRAQALFQLGRYADARAELEEALALNANLHPSWNLLGAVRSALGDPAGAEQAYARALELKPDHPETRFNFALLLHGTDRRGEAIEGYRRALALRPGFVAAREKLADALNEEGVSRYGNKRFGEAIDLYKQALELRPDLDEARNNLGGALAAIGRHDEAIACAREILERRPNHADAHSNLGFSLHALGRIVEAKAQFERALAIRPDHADALSNLGFLLQEEGRLDEAIATFRRALEADPQSAIAGYNLGFALLCRFEFSPGWELSELRYRTTPPMTAPKS